VKKREQNRLLFGILFGFLFGFLFGSTFKKVDFLKVEWDGCVFIQINHSTY
jgi:hypothetical protein